MKKHEVRRVYVWELPVRLYHWVNALCVVVLCATGYLIGAPSRSTAPRGVIRLLSRTVRFILSCRVRLLLNSSSASTGLRRQHLGRWPEFLPFRKDQRREAVEVLKVDVSRPRRRTSSIGHNRCRVHLLVSFPAFLFQCVRVRLYAAMSHGEAAAPVLWIVPLMGANFASASGTTCDVVLHRLLDDPRHLVFYHDYVEGRGVISSMAEDGSSSRAGESRDRDRPEEKAGRSWFWRGKRPSRDEGWRSRVRR